MLQVVKFAMRSLQGELDGPAAIGRALTWLQRTAGCLQGLCADRAQAWLAEATEPPFCLPSTSTAGQEAASLPPSEPRCDSSLRW